MNSNGKNYFVFDEKLTSRLFGIDNRNTSHLSDPIDESDECEATELNPANNEEGEDFRDQHDLEMLKALCEADMKDYSSQLSMAKLDDTQYACIADSTGCIRTVKKSSIVWFMEAGVSRLSNDRIQRVMQTANFYDRQKSIVTEVGKQTVRLGDWCLFKTIDGDNYFLGRVLSLSFIEGSCGQRSKLIWEWDGVQKNIGALCVWFSFERFGTQLTGLLHETNKFTHAYHPFEYYICSCPPPRFEKNLRSSDDMRVVKFDKDVISQLSSLFDHVPPI